MQQNGSTYDAVSMARFVPPVEEPNSVQFDEIKNTNSAVEPFNSYINFTDYKTSIGSTYLSSFNQPANLPVLHTPPAALSQQKPAGPSRFDLDSASALRKRDLATCFGFDSDEE